LIRFSAATNSSSSDPELVLNEARALDLVAPDKRGPLHGLAVGVKDVMNTRGKDETPASSVAYR